MSYFSRRHSRRQPGRHAGIGNGTPGLPSLGVPLRGAEREPTQAPVETRKATGVVGLMLTDAEASFGPLPTEPHSAAGKNSVDYQPADPADPTPDSVDSATNTTSGQEGSTSGMGQYANLGAPAVNSSKLN
jgi:hypothetical protein